MTTSTMQEARELAREMREGDIYRWRWADEKLDADCGPFRSYHCKSQIAVFENGHLSDTYWSTGGSDSWLNPETVKLEFWANVNDLIEVSKYEIVHYRREDIVDLRHANNSRGPVYLKKGAARDAATMLNVIEEKLDAARREIDWANHRIEKLTQDAEKVRSGKLSEVFL